MKTLSSFSAMSSAAKKTNTPRPGSPSIADLTSKGSYTNLSGLPDEIDGKKRRSYNIEQYLNKSRGYNVLPNNGGVSLPPSLDFRQAPSSIYTTDFYMGDDVADAFSDYNKGRSTVETNIMNSPGASGRGAWSIDTDVLNKLADYNAEHDMTRSTIMGPQTSRNPLAAAGPGQGFGVGQGSYMSPSTSPRHPEELQQEVLQSMQGDPEMEQRVLDDMIRVGKKIPYNGIR